LWGIYINPLCAIQFKFARLPKFVRHSFTKKRYLKRSYFLTVHYLNWNHNKYSILSFKSLNYSFRTAFWSFKPIISIMKKAEQNYLLYNFKLMKIYKICHFSYNKQVCKLAFPVRKLFLLQTKMHLYTYWFQVGFHNSGKLFNLKMYDFYRRVWLYNVIFHFFQLQYYANFWFKTYRNFIKHF